VAQTLSSQNISRFAVTLGSVVLVVASLYWAQRVLIPVALAVLLAFLLRPPTSFLERRGLGRLPAVSVVVVLAFFFLAGLSLLITSQLRSLVAELPQYKEKIAQKVVVLRTLTEGTLLENFNNAVKDISDEVLRNDADLGGEKKPEPQPVQIQPTGLARLYALMGPAAEILATIALVVVLLVFMLAQRETLRNRVVAFAGGAHLVVTTRALDDSAHRISRYLFMYLVINVGVGIMLALILMILGMTLSCGKALAQYALFWAFLAATLRFIPYVGTWSVGALLTLYTIAVSDSWIDPVVVFTSFACMELLVGQVLEPLLFGHSIGVSPVALLIALAFWTWLWGPVGLLLATPLTACLVVLGKYVPGLEFINLLLGSSPALEKDLQFYQRLLARDQDEASELVEEELRVRPTEAVYEEILVPTLIRTKRDHARGELGSDDEQFVLEATREIVDVADLPPPLQDAGDDRPLVIGCPARGKADELALDLFRHLVDPALCHFRVLGSELLGSEVVERVRTEQPVVLCIAALPPGGLAPTRYLTKRLRAQFPGVKIVLGRWGQQETLDKIRQRLLELGVDQVGSTLAETRQQLTTLLQVVVRSPRNKKASPQARAAR
jgi:predicted PurR-regulated permease PerM